MKTFQAITLLSLLLHSSASFAQPGLKGRPDGPQGERMEALRIAFFTETLGLSSEDAQVFWPLMQEHEGVLESIRHSQDSLRQIISSPGGLSDEQARSCIDAFLALHESELAAKSAMLLGVADVLGPQRALLIPMAEDKFRRRIMQEVQDRRLPQPPQRRPRR